MNLKLLGRMLKLSSLLTLVLIISSCVTVKDIEVCSVAGRLDAGGICAHSNSSATRSLSFNEMVDYLEASPTKPAAICVTSEDFGKMKLEIEQMCRMLGKRCSYEVVKYLGLEEEMANE